MPKQILQINFNYNASKADLENAFAPFAAPISNVPGLVWKIWLVNDAKKEAGGIYLFEDEASAQNYVTGEIVSGLKTHPALSNLSLKQFGMFEELQKVTRAPVELMISA